MRYYRMAIVNIKTGERDTYISKRQGSAPAGWKCNGVCGYFDKARDMNSAEEGRWTKEMARCRDCAYLVEGDNGEWICDDCGKEIHTIADEDCSAEQEW